jgi:ABC-type multidrug transport system ATPase subunit
LSTVTSADQILVLHAGKVAEAGTHHELLALKGRYANMWKKQIRAERAFEAASQMVAKANALQKAAMERPGSSGNEGGGASEDVSENEADNRSSTTLAPSLTAKAVSKAALNLRNETSNLEDSLLLGDDKSDDSDIDQNRPDDSKRSSTASGTDYKSAEEDKPMSAGMDDSKTHDHS